MAHEEEGYGANLSRLWQPRRCLRGFNMRLVGVWPPLQLSVELHTLEMIRPGRAISLAIAGLNIVRPGPALLLGHINALPPRKDAVSIR